MVRQFYKIFYKSIKKSNKTIETCVLITVMSAIAYMYLLLLWYLRTYISLYSILNPIYKMWVFIISTAVLCQFSDFIVNGICSIQYSLWLIIYIIDIESHLSTSMTFFQDLLNKFMYLDKDISLKKKNYSLHWDRK